MNQKIKKLRERFREAKTETEREAIDIEIDKLIKENQSEFEKAMFSDIENVVSELKDDRLCNKLTEILPVISVSYLAKTYFDKTPQWFYQRLNGNVVNGKQAKFTDNELNVLANALSDISDKIKQSVAFVV
ncbi:MAG: DUF5053 domain-containing protein [Prevotellaceae bacterium]|jgi:hypothetical protein|nr:DUF5053 domain-containing protein [Prevotellaceae bacterium]